MRKTVKTVLLTAALGLAVSLCGMSAAAQDERGTFVFGDYVGNVDPASGAYAWVGMRTGVMESLFKFDDEMNVQKNLVDDYYVSDDGMTWTIVLKDGITFQNGNVCDAEAVRASFERTCSLQARAEGELKIDSMEADGLTLTITTKEPNPTLPNCMCDPYSGIVDVSSLDENGNATIGTGPFKLVEYVEDERMELDAYDDYWGGVPASSHVTIRSISDLDASSLALQKGELDACYGLSYDARDLFDNVPGFKISQAATSRVYKIYFNLEHPFTGDANFRKAVCMAVDRENYAAVLVNGAGTPTKEPLRVRVPQTRICGCLGLCFFFKKFFENCFACTACGIYFPDQGSNPSPLQ